MLVDANLLIFARDSTSRFHSASREWLADVLNGPVRVGLPWQSIVAFVRISTHPRAYERPLSSAAARSQINDWLSAPAAWVPQETDAHREIFSRLAEDHQATGNLVSDVHLAALAISHGLDLYSADSDFARFPEVTWINPLN